MFVFAAIFSKRVATEVTVFINTGVCYILKYQHSWSVGIACNNGNFLLGGKTFCFFFFHIYGFNQVISFHSTSANKWRWNSRTGTGLVQFSNRNGGEGNEVSLSLCLEGSISLGYRISAFLCRHDFFRLFEFKFSPKNKKNPWLFFSTDVSLFYWQQWVFADCSSPVWPHEVHPISWEQVVETWLKLIMPIHMLGWIVTDSVVFLS